MMLLRLAKSKGFWALLGGLALAGSGASLAQDPFDTIDLDPGTATSTPSKGAPGKVDIDPKFTSNLLKEAERYATGDGYRYNPERAYEIYRTVADTGNPTAIFHVARCLILGEGVTLNTKAGMGVLEELARTYILRKGFSHKPGLNPITLERFKMPSQLKPTGVKLTTFTSRDGKLLADPKLLSLNKDGMRVMHATGVASVTWKNVPAHIQNAAGYDIVSVLFEQEILKALKAKKEKKK